MPMTTRERNIWSPAKKYSPLEGPKKVQNLCDFFSILALLWCKRISIRMLIYISWKQRNIYQNVKKVFALLDSPYHWNMNWNRTLLTTGRCIDDPEWWRCIQMHSDAFVTAWREIWCRASSPWPLLWLPKLISTTPWIPNSAKTDIHSTECFCRCLPIFLLQCIC